jgi:hypothetical protein
MRKSLTFSMALMATGLFLGSCSLEDLIDASRDTNSGLKLDEKVVLGLRTALEVGIDSSATVASKLNGYLANKAIQILLPEEAKSALAAAEKLGSVIKPFSSELISIQKLLSIYSGVDKNSFTSNLTTSTTLLSDIDGLASISDSVIKYMNRAAEYAAPRSIPIFKGAITSMSITDGLSLLNSSDSTAATSYLNGKTFNPLTSAYTPIVDSTLTLVPLTKYWGTFRTTYNTVLTRYDQLVAFQNSWNSNAIVSSVSVLQVNKLSAATYKPIETASLGAWTTEKALGGLFYLVGQEEKDIRHDPFAYVKNLASDLSTLLSEVFGDIMKMEK